MSEKKKPRTNPRAGSNDPELWDLDLDWYFNDFESLCGLQSIGTSGAGENQLRPPSEEEKAERRERIKRGFLLTTLDHAKPDFRSVSPADADRGAFEAMSRGIFTKGRWVWKRLGRIPYSAQLLLRQAYEERIPEAGADWGRKPLNDDQVRSAHRAYAGTDTYSGETIKDQIRVATSRQWRNPEPQGTRHEWSDMQVIPYEDLVAMSLGRRQIRVSSEDEE